MKHLIKYILFVLLLSSCNKDAQPPSLVMIADLEVNSENTKETKALDQKNKFEIINGNPDKIYIYGWSKSTIGGVRTRFMPKEGDGITPKLDASSGATYTFKRDELSGWQRFERIIVPAVDENMPYWRPSFYHDFAGYYYYFDEVGYEKPVNATDELIFAMAMDGSVPNSGSGLENRELLWGETQDFLFAGGSQVIPRILFKHQLSRIRVEMLHDMDDITTDNFAVSSITLDIDRTENTFYTQTGLWEDDTPTSYTLTKEWPDPNPLVLGTDIPAPRLETFKVHEWWVLPNCEISNFVLRMYKSALLNVYPMSFKDIFDDLVTTVTTKPGYVTVIRIKFGDIKPIIFSVTLDPWETVPTNVGDITDGLLN